MPSASRSAVGAVLALTAVLLTGCSTPPEPSADDVVASLGAFPVASAAPGVPAPVTASPGHPQLVAMGAPVQVELAGDAKALLTTTGPADTATTHTGRPDEAITGEITVTAAPTAGTVHLAMADLLCQDETGATVALTPSGAGDVTASPGHPATLKLTGRFQTGHAQINWRQAGHVLAIWDFTVEND
ncbi:hypothetical protein [Actinokineospora inagensis]|uniref:hypothetical protein n=1 Tax=Actinokineospora inagensis TaxID=103730 RepID=UPI000413CFCA|nr:hypothetical protein [Actinokineospora inagensis]